MARLFRALPPDLRIHDLRAQRSSAPPYFRELYT